MLDGTQEFIHFPESRLLHAPIGDYLQRRSLVHEVSGAEYLWYHDILYYVFCIMMFGRLTKYNMWDFVWIMYNVQVPYA